MPEMKGGKGLHGPDKQQDRQRDVRSGAYDKGGPSKAPDSDEGQRTEHQRPNRVQMCGRACQTMKRCTRRNLTFPKAWLGKECLR